MDKITLEMSSTEHCSRNVLVTENNEYERVYIGLENVPENIVIYINKETGSWSKKPE